MSERETGMSPANCATLTRQPAHAHAGGSPWSARASAAGNLVYCLGGMNPCSFLGPEYVAGSVAERGFAELWHDSEGFRSIRNLPGGNACGGCGEGDGGGFSGGCRARAIVFNGSVDAADPWLVPATTVDAHPLYTIALHPVRR